MYVKFLELCHFLNMITFYCHQSQRFEPYIEQSPNNSKLITAISSSVDHLIIFYMLYRFFFTFDRTANPIIFRHSMLNELFIADDDLKISSSKVVRCSLSCVKKFLMRNLQIIHILYIYTRARSC